MAASAGATEDAMANWLGEAEAGAWAWDQHAQAGGDAWAGVPKHQAQAHLNALPEGDRVLFYHSGDEKAVVGISEVVRGAYPDPTDPTGAFVSVDLKAVEPLARPVSLSEIKAADTLKDMV